jgi:hypothetical protein
LKKILIFLIVGVIYFTPTILSGQNIRNFYEFDTSFQFESHNLNQNLFDDACLYSDETTLFTIFQKDFKIKRQKKIEFVLFQYDVTTLKVSKETLSVNLTYPNGTRPGKKTMDGLSLHSFCASNKYIVLSYGTWIFVYDRTSRKCKAIDVHNSYIFSDIKENDLVGYRIYNKPVSSGIPKSSFIHLDLTTGTFSLKKIPWIKNVELAYFIPNAWLASSISKNLVVSMDPNTPTIILADTTLKIQSKINFQEDSWTYLDSNQIEKCRKTISPRNPGIWIDSLKSKNLNISKIVNIQIVNDSLLYITYYNPSGLGGALSVPKMRIKVYSINSNYSITIKNSFDCNVPVGIISDYINKTDVHPMLFAQPFIFVGANYLIIAREWYQNIPIYNITNSEVSKLFLREYENRNTEFTFWVFVNRNFAKANKH